MNEIGKKRQEQLLLMLLSEIICNELRNPNIILPTVTDVVLTKDGSWVNVFLVFAQNPIEGLEAVEQSKFYIKRRVAKEWKQKKLPEFVFHLDTTPEKALKIEKILSEIKD